MADVAVVAVALTGLTAACYAFRMWQERRQTHIEPPKPVGQNDTGQASSSAQDVVRVPREVKVKRRGRGEQPPLLEVPVSLGVVVKQGDQQDGEAPIEELLKPELKVEAWLNGLSEMHACGGEMFEGEAASIASEKPRSTKTRSTKSNKSTAETSPASLEEEPSSGPESAEPVVRHSRARTTPPVQAVMISDPEPVITIKEAVRDSTEHPRTMLNSSARQVEASLKFLRRHASTTSRSSGTKLLARSTPSQQRRPPMAKASTSTSQQFRPPMEKPSTSVSQQRRTPVTKTSPCASQQVRPPVAKVSSPTSQQRRPPVVKTSPSASQQRRTPVAKASPSASQQRRSPAAKASPSASQQSRPSAAKASPSASQQSRPQIVKTSSPVSQQRRPPAAKRVEPTAVKSRSIVVHSSSRRLKRVVMVKPRPQLPADEHDCATVTLGPARRRPANYMWRSVAPTKAKSSRLTEIPARKKPEPASKPPRSISEVMDPDHVFDAQLTDSEPDSEPEHFRVTADEMDFNDLITSASDGREREDEDMSASDKSEREETSEGEKGDVEEPARDGSLVHVKTQGFKKLVKEQTHPSSREKQDSETKKL